MDEQKKIKSLKRRYSRSSQPVKNHGHGREWRRPADQGPPTEKCQGNHPAPYVLFK